ncbi:MAG: hypothetical protein V3R25_10145 [Nitrosomonadaceae bacterium]
MKAIRVSMDYTDKEQQADFVADCESIGAKQVIYKFHSGMDTPMFVFVAHDGGIANGLLSLMENDARCLAPIVIGDESAAIEMASGSIGVTNSLVDEVKRLISEYSITKP